MTYCRVFSGTATKNACRIGARVGASVGVPCWGGRSDGRRVTCMQHPKTLVHFQAIACKHSCKLQACMHSVQIISNFMHLHATCTHNPGCMQVAISCMACNCQKKLNTSQLNSIPDPFRACSTKIAIRIVLRNYLKPIVGNEDPPSEVYSEETNKRKEIKIKLVIFDNLVFHAQLRAE